MRKIRKEKAPKETVSPADVDVADYVEPKNPELEVQPKHKRTYRKRQKAQSEASMGKFMRGVGTMLANGTSSLLGVEKPLTKDEGDMLEYCGNQAAEFGDTSALDEQVGKFGLYLIAGSLLIVGLSRVIPALRQKRQHQIPAAIQVE